MPNAKQPSQADKFRQVARDLGCDESEEAFNANLKKVATHKPAPDPKPARKAKK